MKKVLFALSVILVLAVISSSCRRGQNSDTEMAKAMEQLQDQGNESVGVPAIVNFQEKKTLKWIYELCDQADLICYLYLGNEMEGKIGQYLGRCLGYGIPYSAQFSNPVKYTGVTANKVADFAGRNWVYDYVLLPQAEPNNIFKPEGLDATWVIMLDPAMGEPWPVYIEQHILVSPFPLHDESASERSNKETAEIFQRHNSERTNGVVSPYNIQE